MSFHTMFISVVATFSIDTLQSIGEEIELGSIKSMVILIVTVGAVPFLNMALSSDEDRKREEMDKVQKLEKFLKHMEEKGDDKV